MNWSPRTSQELVKQSRHGVMKACSKEVNARMEKKGKKLVGGRQTSITNWMWEFISCWEGESYPQSLSLAPIGSQTSKNSKYKALT